MRAASLLLILGVMAACSGCTTTAQPPTPTTAAFVQPETQEQAVAEIEKHGAKVERDGGTPDGPVVEVSFQLEYKLRTFMPDRSKLETDALLKHLTGLDQLRKLVLVNANVTDAGMDHLKGLHNLQFLYLVNAGVTDAELEHLKGLNQLQVLDLEDTKVTDAGLERIKGLNRLKTLVLSGTHVTDDGVAQLQEALPKCDIVH